MLLLLQMMMEIIKLVLLLLLLMLVSLATPHTREKITECAVQKTSSLFCGVVGGLEWV